MTVAADADPPHVPPPRAPYDAATCGHRRRAAVAAAVVALAGAVRRLPRLQPLVGLIVIMTIAYALSTNRRAIDRRTVAWGLALQIVFALLVLKTARRPARVPDARRRASTGCSISPSSDRASCSARSATRTCGRGS